MFIFREKSTLEEIEALNPTQIDKKTLLLIIIQTLKTYIDNDMETDPKCEALHVHYLLLKQELSAEIPFPEGDGYYRYLNERENRAKHEELKQSGKGCPYCNSSHIQHYGANKFKCANPDCGHYWRVN